MTRDEEINQKARELALDWNVGRGNEFYYRFDKLVDIARWADRTKPNPWINVKDRLPEDNKTVLIWFGGYYAVALLRDNEWWECTGWQSDGGWSALDKISDIATQYITHWMYIPQVSENAN